MCRKALMTFNQKEKIWIKRTPTIYQDHPRFKRFFRRSFRQLQRDYPSLFKGRTKEGTREAANQAWLDWLDIFQNDDPLFDDEISIKQNQLDQANDKLIKYLVKAVQAYGIEDIDNIIRRANPVDFDELERLKIEIEDLKKKKASGESFEFKESLYATIPDRPKIDEVKKMVSTVQKQYLEVQQFRVDDNELTKTSFKAIERHLKFFNEDYKDKNIDEIDESVVLKLKKKIRSKGIASVTMNDYWNSFSHFIDWCYKNSLKKEVPKNMHWTIKFNATTAEIPTVEEARYVLKQCQKQKDELKELVALCHLNFGMYSGDFGSLEHSNFNEHERTITYKRNKTQKYNHLLPVTYPIWDRTFELIMKLKNNNESGPMFLNSLGNQWNSDTIKFSKFKKEHLPEYKHLIRTLRKTTSHEMSEANYNSDVCDQFLQHSSDGVKKTTRKKSYLATLNAIFYKAVAQMEKLFILTEDIDGR